MKFNKKSIKLKISSSNNENNTILESANIRIGGNSFFYRVGDITLISNKRIRKNIKKEDIFKINTNIDLFAEEKNTSKRDIFDNGEKHIVNEDTVYLKTNVYPIKDIAILMMYESEITKITDSCIVDKISGVIRIPSNIEGICSIIYSINNIDPYNTIDKKITYNGFGVKKVGV